MSTLLIASTGQLALADSQYPEDFTPQIIYQDKDYIAKHSDADHTGYSGTNTGGCSCPCGASQTSAQGEPVEGDFEPVILYQDKDYISSH
ncbi:MAG: hypothetical protein K0U68_01910 [Gammaproteobacteria bacterium]|nr:hypothetical protein [Gammaproteobacteria bacterium]